MAFDKTRFGGVVAPIVNPCGEDDSLDRGALEANLTRLLATDVAGLYINGGTGDAANLTQDERLETAALLVPRLLAAGKLAIVHVGQTLSLIHISEPTRLGMISYAVFCLKKKKKCCNNNDERKY